MRFFKRGTKVTPVYTLPSASRIVMAPFYNFVDEVLLTVALAVEGTSITVDDATNIVSGSYLIITDGVTGAFHLCKAVGVPVGNVVTIDSPTGNAFGVGSYVTVGDANLNVPVGTLASPVKYQVRTSLTSQADIALDIHRIMIAAITTSVGDLANFGDGAALTNGILLRKKSKDGTYHVLGNAKTNGDLKGMMYDFELLSASNPQQGANGFSGRYTNTKLGSVIRLNKGEDLEILVQDDLSTRVLSLNILAEGSIADIATV